MNIDKITKEDFEEYEEVRSGGRFNMFEKNARILSGLPEDTYYWIMEHYSELTMKYLEVRG